MSLKLLYFLPALVYLVWSFWTLFTYDSEYCEITGHRRYDEPC